MSFSSYLKETRAELKHVSWPTKEQAIVFTVLVIVISFVMAAYLGAFDLLFTWLLKTFISHA